MRLPAGLVKGFLRFLREAPASLGVRGYPESRSGEGEAAPSPPAGFRQSHHRGVEPHQYSDSDPSVVTRNQYSVPLGAFTV